jgi:hypothetical protein
VEDIGDDGKLG